MQRRQLGADTFCGDLSFVPAAGSSGDAGADDDGHLLVLTHNVRTNTSEMLVLDAKVRLCSWLRAAVQKVCPGIVVASTLALVSPDVRLCVLAPFFPPQDVTADPVARVPIPMRIPFGFHCEFIGSQSHGEVLAKQWP